MRSSRIVKVYNTTPWNGFRTHLHIRGVMGLELKSLSPQLWHKIYTYLSVAAWSISEQRCWRSTKSFKTYFITVRGQPVVHPRWSCVLVAMLFQPPNSCVIPKVSRPKLFDFAKICFVHRWSYDPVRQLLKPFVSRNLAKRLISRMGFGKYRKCLITVFIKEADE